MNSGVFDTLMRGCRKIGNTFLGVEGFTEDGSGNTVVDKKKLESVAVIIVLYSLFGLVIGFAFAFGAARQSYCYNLYIGNSEGVAILFAALCFFFPQLYYPFYAIFLNPVCALGKKNNKGILGGLIGGRR